MLPGQAELCRFLLGPVVVEEIAEDRAACSQDILGSVYMPEHARLLCSFADDRFTTGFDNARAHEVARLPECGVEHTPAVLDEVVEGFEDLILLLGLVIGAIRDLFDEVIDLVRLEPFDPSGSDHGFL